VLLASLIRAFPSSLITPSCLSYSIVFAIPVMVSESAFRVILNCKGLPVALSKRGSSSSPMSLAVSDVNSMSGDIIFMLPTRFIAFGDVSSHAWSAITTIVSWWGEIVRSAPMTEYGVIAKKNGNMLVYKNNLVFKRYADYWSILMITVFGCFWLFR